MSDHLMDMWYFAATSAELKPGKQLRRVILGEPVLVPWADRGWALFMGAVTLSGGMVLYGLGSRVVPAAQMALLANIEVLLGPLLVWLVLGETAGQHVFLGGSILLVAVILNGILGARRPARPASTVA
jgi:drug/metabolite transporter (DMT)-like permease